MNRSLLILVHGNDQSCAWYYHNEQSRLRTAWPLFTHDYATKMTFKLHNWSFRITRLSDWCFNGINAVCATALGAMPRTWNVCLDLVTQLTLESGWAGLQLPNMAMISLGKCQTKMPDHWCWRNVGGAFPFVRILHCRSWVSIGYTHLYTGFLNSHSLRAAEGI